MPPFSKNNAISTFLGVTETIEIVQTLINFFDMDGTLIQMRILLLYIKKIWYFNRKPLIYMHCLGTNVSFPSSQICIFTNAWKTKK